MEQQEERLGFLIADIARLMRQAFAQHLQGSALTLAQGRALVFLARHEGLRQVELAELLDVQPITLARLIDQLEQGGLVERRADPVDRRAYRLFLTPAAAPHLAAIREVGDLISNDALNGLDVEQIAHFTAALNSMRNNLAQTRHSSRDPS